MTIPVSMLDDLFCLDVLVRLVSVVLIEMEYGINRSIISGFAALVVRLALLIWSLNLAGDIQIR